MVKHCCTHEQKQRTPADYISLRLFSCVLYVCVLVTTERQKARETGVKRELAHVGRKQSFFSRNTLVKSKDVKRIHGKSVFIFQYIFFNGHYLDFAKAFDFTLN